MSEITSINKQSRATSGAGKKQILQERRRKKERRQQLITFAIIGIFVVVVAGFVAVPSIIAAATPVGAVIAINPSERPQTDGMSMGDPNAPVRVDVYEDFQCPACKSFTEDVETRLIEAYIKTGKIYYVFHHFPFLDDRVLTKESDQAANASLCANEQGRFWDYHDILFANWDGENEGGFADKRLIAFADNLGLDMDAFNACFAENRYKSQITADLDLGRQIGVTGTPGVFVNGNAVAPGYIPSYEQMQQAIEAALP